jgi:hypothetical protein
MRSRLAIALALIPLLAACVSKPEAAPRPGVSRPTATAQPRRPQRRAPPPARVLALPGLEGVIGASPAQLVQQFGPARLDVFEGDARKLQFAGGRCILDVYLYPPATGAEPRATYLDARREDGEDVDRAACVKALKR